MPSLGKVSTATLAKHALPCSTARKVYAISRLHQGIKVPSELIALDCKRIVDQERFGIPAALTVILRSRMVQITVRQF
jgi:hypothetical protein